MIFAMFCELKPLKRWSRTVFFLLGFSPKISFQLMDVSDVMIDDFRLRRDTAWSPDQNDHGAVKNGPLHPWPNPERNRVTYVTLWTHGQNIREIRHVSDVFKVDVPYLLRNS